jgi:O-antigen/teichoic acid export membrane protein
VTVVGLLVVLPEAGIMGAAWISTASYATVFVCALIAYKRAVRLPWRRFVSGPDRARAPEPVTAEQ